MGFLKDLAKQLPVVGGIFDDSGDRAVDAVGQNRAIYEAINLPELMDFEFTPDAIDFKTIQEDPMVLQSQLAALEQMKNLANEGLAPEDRLAMARANQEAGQRTRQSRGAALQNALARGVAGSGMEMALGEMANQGAAERARMQGMEQAANSAKMRALNQMNYANSLGNVRSQDLGVKQANTGIMNQFNTLNTQAANQARLDNLNRKNMNRQQQFGNEMAIAAGKTGANQAVANAYAAQNAANQDARNANTKLLGSGLGFIL